MMAELMAFLVIFDTIFYYCHRLLHTRNFYKYILFVSSDRSSLCPMSQ